jgi:hypothetical protein
MEGRNMLSDVSARLVPVCLSSISIFAQGKSAVMAVSG